MSSSVQAAAGVADKLVTALPAQFLALCVINVLFVGSILLFLRSESASRAAFSEKIVAACITKIERP